MDHRDLPVFEDDEDDDEDYEPGVYDLLARERQEVKFKAYRNQQTRDLMDSVTIQRRDFAHDPKAPRPYPKLAPFVTRRRGRERDRAYGSWLGQEPNEPAELSSEELRDLQQRRNMNRYHGQSNAESFPLDANPRRRNTDGSVGGIAPPYEHDAPPPYPPPSYDQAFQSKGGDNLRGPGRQDSGLSSTSSLDFRNDLRMERASAQSRRLYEARIIYGGRHIYSGHSEGRQRDSTHRR